MENQLLLACENGSLDMVKAIENMKEFNRNSNVREMLLCIACMYGHVDLVDHFIKNGCDINFEKSKPLFIASE